MGAGETAVRQRLSEAVRALRSDGVPLARRVEAATSELWSAMFDRDGWPPESLERAERIMDAILINGPVKTTIPGMDEGTLEQLAQRILALVAEVHAAVRDAS